MTKWTQIERYGETIRFRYRELDEFGWPLQLELEHMRQGEWEEVRPDNVREGFRMGFMAARNAKRKDETDQVNLFRGAEQK